MALRSKMPFPKVGLGELVGGNCTSSECPNLEFGQFALSPASEGIVGLGTVSACYHDKDERNWSSGRRDMAVRMWAQNGIREQRHWPRGSYQGNTSSAIQHYHLPIYSYSSADWVATQSRVPLTTLEGPFGACKNVQVEQLPGDPQ